MIVYVRTVRNKSCDLSYCIFDEGCKDHCLSEGVLELYYR